jgi:hypothetical protein
VKRKLDPTAVVLWLDAVYSGGLAGALMPFCQTCGQEQPGNVGVCPRCGYRQNLASVSAPSTVLFPQRVPDHLRGVGGWLLFLCIGLTFFAPVSQALIAAKALRNLATLRLSIQTFLRIGTVGTIYGGLAIFSCIAGVMLWMENPRGVSVAKAYFLVAAVLPILLYSALRFAGMEVDLLRIVLGRLASSAMWYAYLSSSRRVKLTYGAT